MPDEDLTIKLSATGANQAAGEVRKVADATEGFGGQAEGTDAFLRTLDETLEDTERTVMEVAEAMEELEEVQERLNDVTEEGVEVNEEANRERRRLAEEDVETVKRARADEEESLRRRARVTTAAVAGGAALLAQFSKQLIQHNENLRAIDGEAAKSVDELAVSASDYADIATQIAVGAAAGGPFGAIAGAVSGAFGLVTQKAAEARQALEESRERFTEITRGFQALVDAERQRAGNLQRGEIEQSYRNQIKLIENQIAVLRQRNELERITSGGEADRDQIERTERRRQIENSDAGELEKESLRAAEEFAERARVNQARIDESNRVIEETRAELAELSRKQLAAETKSFELRNGQFGLSANDELREQLENPEISTGDKNRILGADRQSVGAESERFDAAATAAFEEAGRLADAQTDLTRRLEQLTASAREVQATFATELAAFSARQSDDFREAAEAELTQLTTEAREALGAAAQVPLEALNRPARLALETLQQAEADGVITLEEQARVSQALRAFNEEFNQSTDAMVEALGQSVQVSIASEQAINAATQRMGLLEASLRRIEREQSGRLQQLEARGGQN